MLFPPKIRSCIPIAFRPQPRNRVKLKLLSSGWMGEVPSSRGRAGSSSLLDPPPPCHALCMIRAAHGPLLSSMLWSLLASFWWHINNTRPPTCPATLPPSLASASMLAMRRRDASRDRRRSTIHSRRNASAGCRCDASAGCVARSSTIRPRRDASAVHRVPHRRHRASSVRAGSRKGGGRRHRASRVHRRFTVVAMRRRDASRVRRRFALVAMHRALVAMRRRSIACRVVATDMHQKLEATVSVPPPPPRCRRPMDGGSRSGRGGRRGNWDRPCSQRRGRGRWRKMTSTSPPTTPCSASEDWERTRNEEWKEDEMEEEKQRHKKGGSDGGGGRTTNGRRMRWRRRRNDNITINISRRRRRRRRNEEWKEEEMEEEKRQHKKGG
jgi:hypothetical protein